MRKRERVKLGHRIKAQQSIAAGRLRLERKPRDLMRPVFIITSRSYRLYIYERERESCWSRIYLLILYRSGFGAISREDAESHAAAALSRTCGVNDNKSAYRWLIGVDELRLDERTSNQWRKKKKSSSSFISRPTFGEEKKREQSRENISNRMEREKKQLVCAVISVAGTGAALHSCRLLLLLERREFNIWLSIRIRWVERERRTIQEVENKKKFFFLFCF